LQHLVSGEQWYVQLMTGELIGTEIQRGWAHGRAVGISDDD
jgi:hypothetical protein